MDQNIADAAAPCVAGTPIAMVLTLQDEVHIFARKDFKKYMHIVDKQ